ncbi:hypothetical protein KAR91_79835 [Candidatus Pacearchaeota archaeon]|nr:hypothetical protein [Candidatus Pacearchaeota archaeon]
MRVLFIIKASIQNGANRAMEDMFGGAGTNTFDVPFTKGSVDYYAACMNISRERLLAFKEKIKNHISLGNAIVFTKSGRVKLNNEGYTRPI